MTGAAPISATPPIIRPYGAEHSIGQSIAGEFLPEGALIEGRYTVRGLLGWGGMAVVYLVQDPSGARHALKHLSEHVLQSATAAARFHREARLLAELDHPGIVRARDIGEHLGRPYLVMEYLPAGSLRDRLLHEGPLPTEVAVGIMVRVLDALQAAHDAGIVHRDVKPGNILMDLDARPHLCDFGIARPRSQTALTHSGVTVGTNSYMPPEQATDSSLVTPLADVYAAGATLFTLLTGRRSFGLYQETKTSERLQYLPPGPRRVVYRATRFEPEARYRSAREMRDALLSMDASVDDPRDTSEVARPRRVGLLAVLVALAGLFTLGWLGAVFSVAAVVGRRAEAQPAPVPVVVVAPPAHAPPRTAVEEAPVLDEEPAPPPVAPSAATLGTPPVQEPASAAPAPTTEVFVNSLPPSEVWVDDVNLGVTGWSGLLPVGPHELELRAEGFEAARRSLVVPEEGVLRICWDFGLGGPCRR